MSNLYFQASEPSSGPSTPQQSSSNGAAREPPPLTHKRPLDKSPNGIGGNEAKQARRNLFPSKTTHCIKDLNPYQNKYTIQARVIKKSGKKTWSNSRGEGCVFDFELKDASGEIKVTAFNDEANKYFDTIQEGKVYYLSNGKIAPVRKPEYNNVSVIFIIPYLSWFGLALFERKNFTNICFSSFSYRIAKKYVSF